MRVATAMVVRVCLLPSPVSEVPPLVQEGRCSRGGGGEVKPLDKIPQQLLLLQQQRHSIYGGAVMNCQHLQTQTHTLRGKGLVILQYYLIWLDMTEI